MYRRHPIVPDEIYHIFNRGIASQPIFLSKRDYERFCNVVDFYRFLDPGMRFSHYNRLEVKQQKIFLEKLYETGQKQVIIFSFCLMPNHFHLLLKEIIRGGTQKFISNIQNSYAKYFNTRMKRTGSLFQEMFKAVRVETDEQFLHVARYIHLNPYSSFVVKNIDELNSYLWSSLRKYLKGEDCFSFIDESFLQSFYPSKDKLKTFTFDQVDYQRRLKEIGYLTIE